MNFNKGIIMTKITYDLENKIEVFTVCIEALDGKISLRKIAENHCINKNNIFNCIYCVLENQLKLKIEFGNSIDYYRKNYNVYINKLIEIKKELEAELIKVNSSNNIIGEQTTYSQFIDYSITADVLNMMSLDDVVKKYPSLSKLDIVNTVLNVIDRNMVNSYVPSNITVLNDEVMRIIYSLTDDFKELIKFKRESLRKLHESTSAVKWSNEVESKPEKTNMVEDTENVAKLFSLKSQYKSDIKSLNIVLEAFDKFSTFSSTCDKHSINGDTLLKLINIVVSKICNVKIPHNLGIIRIRNDYSFCCEDLVKEQRRLINELDIINQKIQTKALKIGTDVGKSGIYEPTYVKAENLYKKESKMEIKQMDLKQIFILRNVCTYLNSITNIIEKVRLTEELKGEYTMINGVEITKLHEYTSNANKISNSVPPRQFAFPQQASFQQQTQTEQTTDVKSEGFTNIEIILTCDKLNLIQQKLNEISDIIFESNFKVDDDFKVVD